jgi:hypothetical protein
MQKIYLLRLLILWSNINVSVLIRNIKYLIYNKKIKSISLLSLKRYTEKNYFLFMNFVILYKKIRYICIKKIQKFINKIRSFLKFKVFSCLYLYNFNLYIYMYKIRVVVYTNWV